MRLMLEDRIIFKEITVISELLKWYKGIQGKSSQTGGGYQEKMHNSWMTVHECAMIVFINTEAHGILVLMVLD